MKDSSRITGGLDVTGLLQVAFIVLKLLGRIDWPWIWVLSPTWIWIVIGIFLLGIIVITDR